MIRLFEGSSFDSFQFEDVFSFTKIKANLLSYGKVYSFLSFWEQYNQNSLTALLCKYEETFIIVATQNADISELKNFISAVGFNSIQAHPTLLKKLNLSPLKQYTVLFKKAKGQNVLLDPPCAQKIYTILYHQDSPNIKRFDFSGFYADLSHRLRHKTAWAVIYKDVSVALASHITQDAAIISGVATLCDFRGKGYGSKALDDLGKYLGDKTIFVASEPEIKQFYINNSFTEKDTVAIYETEE